MACQFESILALLDGYAIWLQSGRQADNLVARIGNAETAPFPQIDPCTRDQYLRLLKQYLSWCVTHYIPRARQNSTTLANIEAVFADVGYDLERATDELRRVCGCSDTSTMPRRYASRYLAESANLHNAQRASAAWSRLDS